MKQFSTLAGVIGLGGLEVFTTGCSDRYPQLSAKCELQSSFYTDPEFAGEKNLSWDLTIIHRMRYEPNTLDDQLRFEFTPRDSDSEIAGAVVLDLELLTTADESSFPHEYFRGETIHKERTYYGGAFCNYQYQYQAFAILTPGEKLLNDVYLQRGDYLETQPNGMQINETKYPEEMEINEDAVDKWYEAIENNGDKITLELFIERNVKDDLGGCYASESYLPPETRGSESLHAIYHSTELHDDEDPRIGFEELLYNSIQPIDLFKEVISGVKDLD